jgi:hypothetical protein
MADHSALTAAVKAGNRAEAVRLTQEAIDAGTEPRASALLPRIGDQQLGHRGGRGA